MSEEESGTHSKVSIRTRDRPGLLTDIVHTLKDISVNVISAEVRPRPVLLTPQLCCMHGFVHWCVRISMHAWISSVVDLCLHEC